ncbi:MAG TPA: UDP-3-O-(3-hydroxymyristoyl)glucosamine N-acyltransferase [Thermodesulfovibrionales bacterium]|nr:UDP-3-O-(3-hydroxymyristoyl)glucosamine N-acyltransferase [Thermodesulfovibrionales bacterium]
MKLKDIAAMFDGETKGDSERDIRGVAGIHEVREDEITFLSDKRLAKECSQSKAAAVLVRDFFAGLDKPQVVVKNPQYAFAKLLEHFYVTPAVPAGVSSLAFVSGTATVAGDVTIYPLAYVSDGAKIGAGTVIYPGVFVGCDSVIGSRCIIYPNVTVREKVRIGDGVIIHSGSVIGSDGFGYVFEEGRHYKIPQVGGVIIGDDVEIGANVAIDRATTGNTLIGKGVKIDNLAQIAHNVTIGDNAVIISQVGIAGSSRIGAFVMLGGQVGVADHTEIEDGCMIAAKSGVMGRLSKGVYGGCPAIPHRDWLKSSAIFSRLPELSRKIRELEEKIEVLEGRQS